MKILIGVDLRLPPEAAERLQRLQAVFASACNRISPVAQSHRCWNRVALHHLVYRDVREQFPQLGSQMSCNAIYAVSRACRLVYEAVDSPFNVRRLGARTLPQIRFMPGAPVYFDRHTLSLRDGEVSLFTLEGRMHCPVAITPQQARHLSEGHIEEIALHCRDGRHGLDFRVESDAAVGARSARLRKMPTALPDHVLVQSTGEPSTEHAAAPSR